jgi:O-antigen/teichoic acid export membrane protein
MSNSIDLTSGWLLARNTMLNLVSEVLPFLVAIFAIPMLVRGLGIDRYGVLTLSMMVVGYFGLFDLGLGRAATKFIAEAAASGDHSKIPALFWTSLYLMLAFGTAGSILIAALAPWLVHNVLKIPISFQPESLHAFYLLSFSMPFVISGGSLGGTLSAYQRFDLINAIRVPTGVFFYLGPLAVLPFSHNLAWMVAVMVLGRLVSWGASFALCLRAVPAFRQGCGPNRDTVPAMLSFGGWITISNVIAPIMAYFDRFLIGAMLSMAAVSYYAVPYQVATKLWIIPGSIVGVVFAALSSSLAQDPMRAALIFERATRYILLALFPPILLLIVFAPEGLALWVGPSFATHGAGVMCWLAVGVFVNSAAWPSLALVQAANRPDLITKLYLIQVPLYVGFLWWALESWGLEGAATAWTLRAVADAIFLFMVARRLLVMTVSAITRLGAIAAIAIVVLGLGALQMDLAAKILFIAVTLGSFALLGWTVLLDTG